MARADGTELMRFRVWFVHVGLDPPQPNIEGRQAAGDPAEHSLRECPVLRVNRSTPSGQRRPGGVRMLPGPPIREPPMFVQAP